MGDKHYTIPALTTANRGVGYIALQPQNSGTVGVVAKTLIVRNKKGKEAGIHIDFDAEGRIFGIEVMDDSLLPPELS